MKTLTKILLGITAVGSAVMQSATVQAWAIHFVAAHPGLAGIIGGLTTVGAILHSPNNGTQG